MTLPSLLSLALDLVRENHHAKRHTHHRERSFFSQSAREGRQLQRDLRFRKFNLARPQRHATSDETAARFIGLCEKAGVPCQQYAHRSDLGCGSTIGPIVASQFGVASVDVGSPMWAMHSARESAGVHDHAYMIAALAAAFGS